MVSTTPTKDLRKVPGGKARAAQRWSNPENRTSVRIDELTPDQRRLVLALVDAAKAGKASTDA